MLRGTRVGRCPVCGGLTLFAGFTDNVRESGTCLRCGSSNRQRQLAHVMRRVHAGRNEGPLLAGIPLAIYNTESNGALHRALRARAAYTSSEYFGPHRPSGALVDGTRHEDLQSLSFASDRFDLVLSSDVLEHVPDPYRAHEEIRRVLRPGGRHLFTVPYDVLLEADDVRARLVGDRIEHLAEPLHHRDPLRPDEGVLVWRIFGREMPTRLRAIGFDVVVHELHAPAFGIVGHGAFVFEAIKSTADARPLRR